MKTIKFTIKTPGGKTKTVTLSDKYYWSAKLEAEKQGEIIDQVLIKTSTNDSRTK